MAKWNLISPTNFEGAVEFEVKCVIFVGSRSITASFLLETVNPIMVVISPSCYMTRNYNIFRANMMLTILLHSLDSGCFQEDLVLIENDWLAI